VLEPGGVCFITNERAELAGAQLRFKCGFERHCSSNSLLDAAGGMLLHPNDVRIVRRRLGIGAGKASHVRCGEWKKGAGIFPAFDFGMAIRERKSGGVVVVSGGPVDHEKIGWLKPREAKARCMKKASFSSSSINKIKHAFSMRFHHHHSGHRSCRGVICRGLPDSGFPQIFWQVVAAM